MSFPDYDKVPPTMITLICVPRDSFPMKDLFLKFKVKTLETKKNRNGDPIKKGLCGDEEGMAPRGTIYSCSYGNLTRGTLFFPQKKTWCKECKLYGEKTKKNGKPIKVMTMSRFIEKKKIEGVLCHVSGFECHNCNKKFYPTDAKSLTTFPTQISVYFSMGNYGIHAMIFKKGDGENKIKLAGCKKYEDGKFFMDHLYYKYLFPYNLVPPLQEGKTRPVKIYGGGRNKKFSIPFSVDREKLTEIFSRPEYQEVVSNVTFEQGDQTSVQIKMYSQDSEVEYFKVSVGQKKSVGKIFREPLDGRNNGMITFIVFTSSDANPEISVFQVMGKDFLSHKKCYDFFTKIVSENRKELEEFFD